MIADTKNFLRTMEFDLSFHKSFNTYTGGEVVGASNGFVCIKWGRFLDISNPLVQKYTTLPGTRFMKHMWARIHQVTYGFGYDHLHDDYKVVRIAHYEGIGSILDENEVKVYSRKSNKWRRIEDFRHIPVGAYSNGVFVSGALHWMVRVNPGLFLPSLPDKIVSFDIVNEGYCSIPLPQCTPCMIQNKMFMRLWELGGRLSVQCSYRKMNIDVWVMNTYGIADSWTKLHSIQQPINSHLSEYMIALAYSKNGEKLLLRQKRGMLVWYDIKSETVEDSSIINSRISSDPYIYTDSLMKPTVGKPKIKKSNVAPQRKSERKRKTPPRSCWIWEEDETKFSREVKSQTRHDSFLQLNLLWIYMFD